MSALRTQSLKMVNACWSGLNAKVMSSSTGTMCVKNVAMAAMSAKKVWACALNAMIHLTSSSEATVAARENNLTLASVAMKEMKDACTEHTSRVICVKFALLIAGSVKMRQATVLIALMATLSMMKDSVSWMLATVTSLMDLKMTLLVAGLTVSRRIDCSQSWMLKMNSLTGAIGVLSAQSKVKDPVVAVTHSLPLQELNLHTLSSMAL